MRGTNVKVSLREFQMSCRQVLEVRSEDRTPQKWSVSLREDVFDSFLSRAGNNLHKVFGQGSFFSPLLFGKFFDPSDAFPLWDFEAEILLSGLHGSSGTSVDWLTTDTEYVLKAGLPDEQIPWLRAGFKDRSPYLPVLLHITERNRKIELVTSSRGFRQLPSISKRSYCSRNRVYDYYSSENLKAHPYLFYPPKSKRMDNRRDYRSAAGSKNQDVQIYVDNGKVMEISGQWRQRESDAKDWRTGHWWEYGYVRRLELPENANWISIEANIDEEHVLEIRIPKNVCDPNTSKEKMTGPKESELV